MLACKSMMVYAATHNMAFSFVGGGVLLQLHSNNCVCASPSSAHGYSVPAAVPSPQQCTG